METWIDGLLLLPAFLIAFVFSASMTEVFPRARAHWLVLSGALVWGCFSLLLDNSLEAFAHVLWPDEEGICFCYLYWHGPATETLGALSGMLASLVSRRWRNPPTHADDIRANA